MEASDSKLWSECLNAQCVLPFVDSREKLETWHRYDDEERPHAVIGYNVSIALAKSR
ncbi:hypothetical protein GOZ90_24680 [Agrobacterium vitis]|nr:hypothetical protein [Agrobacterium vitis]